MVQLGLCRPHKRAGTRLNPAVLAGPLAAAVAANIRALHETISHSVSARRDRGETSTHIH